MTKKKGTPNPWVKKALDGVANVVLGPKTGRGAEPQDARELTEETDSADEQQPGGGR